MAELILQKRRNGELWLNLSCGLNEQGDFVIAGHDLGPGTEYEWWTPVAAVDIPTLIELLGGAPEDDLFEILEREWVPVEGDGLERKIRSSVVPSSFSNYHHFD